MAETTTIARPYARAAFAYARERQALGGWSQLLAVAAAVAADAPAAALFGDPRVRAGELVELLAGVATGAGVAVDDGARNFLRLLAENRRLALLPEIALQFEAQRAEAEHTLDVEVTTAMPLSTAQRAALGAALKNRFGREVRITEQVDASLIGGAVVRAGDLVIDGSLVERLRRLEQQISRP